MYVLKTEASFDSAHFLAGYVGKCSNLHGHRWKLVVEVSAETLNEEGQLRGMVTDFGNLKEDLKNIADEFDHAFIYEAGTLKETTIAALNDEGFRLIKVDFRPTAENFAKYFFEIMEDKGYNCLSMEVYETPNNVARYSK